MDTLYLIQQIDKARAHGQKEVTYYEQGQKIQLIIPEISPRTTDMMY